MQAPSKKAGSFNTVLDTVRQSNVAPASCVDAQMFVLRTLVDRETVGIGDLVKSTSLPPAEGIKLINEMENSQIIVALASDTGVKAYELTENGRAIASSMLAS